MNTEIMPYQKPEVSLAYEPVEPQLDVFSDAWLLHRDFCTQLGVDSRSVSFFSCATFTVAGSEQIVSFGMSIRRDGFGFQAKMTIDVEFDEIPSGDFVQRMLMQVGREGVDRLVMQPNKSGIFTLFPYLVNQMEDPQLVRNSALSQLLFRLKV